MPMLNEDLLSYYENLIDQLFRYTQNKLLEDWKDAIWAVYGTHSGYFHAFQKGLYTDMKLLEFMDFALAKIRGAEKAVADYANLLQERKTKEDIEYF